MKLAGRRRRLRCVPTAAELGRARLELGQAVTDGSRGPISSRDQAPTSHPLLTEAEAFYSQGLVTLRDSGVPFLVGGAYALGCYTGIPPRTRDLDVFVRREDCKRALEVLADAGCETELTFPHWLGKASCGQDYIDVIFSSGNGIANVDDVWFEHAPDEHVLGLRIKLCPPEEMIWQKAFIMEYDRFDGADVAHLFRARGQSLDWARLLSRFGPHWRVLLSHVLLFGFIYPGERSKIPDRLIDELLGRLGSDRDSPPGTDRLCQGTLLSRARYLIDLERWGYRDARLVPQGRMTEADIAHWTAAIDQEKVK
jgi:hypothetical protein